MHILHDAFLLQHFTTLPAAAFFLKINWSLVLQIISTSVAVATILLVFA